MDYGRDGRTVTMDHDAVRGAALKILRGEVIHLPGGLTAGAYTPALRDETTHTHAILGPRAEVVVLAHDVYEVAREAVRILHLIMQDGLGEALAVYAVDAGGRHLPTDAEAVTNERVRAWYEQHRFGYWAVIERQRQQASCAHTSVGLLRCNDCLMPRMRIERGKA